MSEHRCDFQEAAEACTELSMALVAAQVELQRRDIALANGREEIERLRAELLRFKEHHRILWNIERDACVQLRRRLEEARAKRDAARLELGRLRMEALRVVGSQAAEIEDLHSQVAHLTAERNALAKQLTDSAQQHATDSPPNPGAGPRKEPT